MNNPASTNIAIVTAITQQRLTVTQAATRFNRSRQWIYTLLKRYEEGGIEALTPQSTAPKSSPHKTNAQVRAAILTIRRTLSKQGSDNGPATIAWHLRNQGYNTPSESTIRRILHEEGLIVPQPHKRARSTYRRFEAQLPNECWQADVTHIRLAGGQAIEVLDFLDDHSRYLLHLKAYTNVTAAIVVADMTTLCEEYGFPQSTLTDNGLIFTARYSQGRSTLKGLNAFESYLATHSIKQKNGRPSHPQTQGKIERFHQTLKKWLKARPRPRGIAAAQKLLDEFRTWYNTQRPHQALNRRTPHTVYTDLPKATPEPFITEDNRVRRDTVDKDGRITLRYAGKMRYLGMGRRHNGTLTLTVVAGIQATTTNRETGEIIGLHTLNPSRQYQPNELNTEHLPDETRA